MNRDTHGENAKGLNKQRLRKQTGRWRSRGDPCSFWRGPSPANTAELNIRPTRAVCVVLRHPVCGTSVTAAKERNTCEWVVYLRWNTEDVLIGIKMCRWCSLFSSLRRDCGSFWVETGMEWWCIFPSCMYFVTIIKEQHFLQMIHPSLSTWDSKATKLKEAPPSAGLNRYTIFPKNRRAYSKIKIITKAGRQNTFMCGLCRLGSAKFN